MTTDFETIFDGTDLTGWVHIGPGHFESEPDGSIRSVGGMGLLWYSARSYRDFVVQVEYKSEQAKSNSGVFVRFPEPREDPWNPVYEGHEIQICDTPTEPKHRTGAIYDIKARRMSRPKRLASGT